jgi:hypothetical protein
MSNPLFGVIPAGQPLITEPASMPSPTSVLYALPPAKQFSHIVVFLLPGVTLPESSAAAIYLTTTNDVAAAAQAGRAPNFRFLGAIGPGKESAMFKVSGSATGTQGDGNGLMVGIEVESADAVSQRMQNLASDKSQSAPSTVSTQPSTVVLAQRIIENAFNFLSSFSGAAGPGDVEVVPLKAFEEWWRKFESKVRADPSFLERRAD